MSKIKKFKKSLKWLNFCLLHYGYKNLPNPKRAQRDFVVKLKPNNLAIVGNHASWNLCYLYIGNTRINNLRQWFIFGLRMYFAHVCTAFQYLPWNGFIVNACKNNVTRRTVLNVKPYIMLRGTRHQIRVFLRILTNIDGICSIVKCKKIGLHCYSNSILYFICLYKSIVSEYSILTLAIFIDANPLSMKLSIFKFTLVIIGQLGPVVIYTFTVL